MGDQLIAMHANLRAFYRLQRDRVAGEALARRGHRIDASPRAMTLELRRLGFAEANAPGLMRRARLDARARACATSSLQATQAGFPVYRRLGYRDVCAINMWEHR